jgi:hypothetical protein
VRTENADVLGMRNIVVLPSGKIVNLDRVAYANPVRQNSERALELIFSGSAPQMTMRVEGTDLAALLKELKQRGVVTANLHAALSIPAAPTRSTVRVTGL